MIAKRLTFTVYRFSLYNIFDHVAPSRKIEHTGNRYPYILKPSHYCSPYVIVITILTHLQNLWQMLSIQSQAKRAALLAIF
jgi:hypothetical protein